MNKTLGALLIAFCHGSALFAAPAVVKLSGVVSMRGGGVLKDVTLSLASASSVTATSDAEGRFLLSIGSTQARRMVDPEGLPFSWNIEGSDIVVSMKTETVDGAIDVFSPGGQRTFSANFGAHGSSARRVAAQTFTPGLNVVRVRIGRNVYVGSVLRMDGALHLDAGFSRTTTDGALGRTSAVTVVDTLVAKKTGFAEKRTPIAAYIDSNLAIAMDSLAGGCTPPKAGTSKSNPIFTDVYTADPAAMVDNCTFYIPCGHDQGTGGFDLREWYLLKSTDMVNWTRTTPMTLKIFSWTNANAWAGQMIKARNGKYYWYVPINDIVFSQDRMAIGVAVADKPEGPWKDALGKPLVNDSLEMATWGVTNIDQTPHTIDPTVFIDDDGQAYLQYGGFWRMITAKLNPDMISISGKLTETTPADYFESPYLIKRNGTYYEIYAHGSANPTTIDYATSKSPMGPWTHKGTILDVMPKATGQDETTNHAGVAEFAGQWYIVYHVSNGPNGGGTYKREVAIDKLTFNADGTIKPVTPSSALSF